MTITITVTLFNFAVFMLVQYYFGLGAMLLTAACFVLVAMTLLYIGTTHVDTLNKKVPVPPSNTSSDDNLH